MAFGSNKENIQIVATARDQASPTLRKLQANVNSLGSKGRGPLGGLLGGLGGISPAAMIGAVGIGVLTGALADGLAGALAEEKQLARLGAALKANVKDWDGSTAAVDRATDAAMDLAFSDDEARESMIKLITATGNVEESTRDMALAMNIARGRNIDLASATDIVIKANMGNVGALRRLGIEVDKNASSVEILSTLWERYGGQADAYANTTAGKFEAAQKKVDNALEEVGHKAIEATSALLSYDQALKGDPQAAADFLRLTSFGTLGLGNMIADALEGAVDEIGSRGAKDELGRSAGDWMFGGLEAAAEDAGDDSAAALSAAFVATIRRREQDFAAAGDAIRENLGQLSPNIAQMRVGRGIKDILKDLNWAINHPEKLEKWGQKIQEALNNPKLQAALGSNNPFLQLAGQQTQTALEGLWTNITGGSDTSADAVDALRLSLERLENQINGMPHGPLFGVFGGNPYRPGQAPGRAAGGPVDAGETYVVGERGPELLHMGRNGSVTPNHQLGGSTPPVNVYVDGRLLFQVMDERMGRRLARTPAGVVNRG